MTPNAILCAGLVVGFAIGGLVGYLFAWDEANELFEARYRRWREHCNRLLGRHYYKV